VVLSGSKHPKDKWHTSFWRLGNPIYHSHHCIPSLNLSLFFSPFGKSFFLKNIWRILELLLKNITLCENACELQSSLRECKQAYLEDWVWSGPIPYRWAMWSDHGPEAWRYRLYFSKFWLVISVGRDWSVHSDLEFNAIHCKNKNLRIISDVKRVFWIVLFRIASLVFLFFTPSDSSLVRNWFLCREPRSPVVKLICVAFQPLFSRLLRWLMKPKRELYLSSFSCSFFSAQSSLVSIALVYSRNTHDFFPCQKLARLVCRRWRFLGIFDLTCFYYWKQ